MKGFKVKQKQNACALRIVKGDKRVANLARGRIDRQISEGEGEGESTGDGDFLRA